MGYGNDRWRALPFSPLLVNQPEMISKVSYIATNTNQINRNSIMEEIKVSIMSQLLDRGRTYYNKNLTDGTW